MLSAVAADETLLARLERYYDAVPRAWSRMEEIGPFTLFVARSGWPYYARPRPGGQPAATVDDVQAVLARQRDLEVPQALEWVDETTPGLLETVRAAGVAVEECPLLVLEGRPLGAAGPARLLSADDKTMVLQAQASINLAFQSSGTATGSAGLPERDAGLSAASIAADESGLWGRLSAGSIRMAAVSVASPERDLTDSAGRAAPVSAGSRREVVGGGSSIHVGDVAEIVGVGVLPAYRRQGLARQLTYVLAMDALDQGVTTVFCSAQSDDVARVYQAVGFRRVGTACIASAEPH